jgi:hypothetical protein
MAKVKKAQLGDHLVKRKSQDDRIHRIEKKDPERAERVAARVQKRALRSVKPSSVKPPSRMSIPLRERAKAARAKKAQSGDSLVKKYPSVKMSTRKGYETKETTYPGGDKETLRTKVSKALKDHNMFKESYNEAKSRLNKAAKKSAIQSSKEISGKRPAKIKTAQSGDSLVYETKGARYPKRRLAVDTTGYAAGKKTFKGTGRYLEGLESGVYKDYPAKPKKYGRKIVKSIINAKGATPKKKAGGKVSKK